MEGVLKFTIVNSRREEEATYPPSTLYENAAESPALWTGMNAAESSFDRRDIPVPPAFSPRLESLGYP